VRWTDVLGELNKILNFEVDLSFSN
jgi:hypothetical protein